MRIPPMTFIRLEIAPGAIRVRVMAAEARLRDSLVGVHGLTTRSWFAPPVRFATASPLRFRTKTTQEFVCTRLAY
jgi:hypothetical protein